MRKTEDPIRKLVVRRNIADWIRPAVYSAQRSVGQRRMPGAVRVPCRDSRVWPPTEHVGGSVVRGDPGDRPAKSGLRHGHQPGGRAGSPMLPEWSGVHIVRSRCAVRRASPPGDAAVDRDRRETYGAALQQFDELMAAARVVSAVSRPIPQYYSMHQAARPSPLLGPPRTGRSQVMALPRTPARERYGAVTYSSSASGREGRVSSARSRPYWEAPG